MPADLNASLVDIKKGTKKLRVLHATLTPDSRVWDGDGDEDEDGVQQRLGVLIYVACA